MGLWGRAAKAFLIFVTAIAYTPVATLAFATAAPAAHKAVTGSDDSDGDDSGQGDEEDGPPPCLPGNAPSAITGRCVPDFPEHECPDGGMSIWNRCPQGDPCAGGGASVNGQCPGPTERFCDDGVSFEGSCGEDSESAAPLLFGPRRAAISSSY